MSYSVLGSASSLCSSSQQNALKKLSTGAMSTSSFHILFSIYNNRVSTTNMPLRWLSTVTSMLPYSKTILCSFLNTTSLQYLTLMPCRLQLLNNLHSLFLRHILLIFLLLVAFFFLSLFCSVFPFLEQHHQELSLIFFFYTPPHIFILSVVGCVNSIFKMEHKSNNIHPVTIILARVTDISL